MTRDTPSIKPSSAALRMIEKSAKRKRSLFRRAIRKVQRSAHSLARTRTVSSRQRCGAVSDEASFPLQVYILYRHVSLNRVNQNRDREQRPAWFSYETCYRNLVSTLAADRCASQVKLVVLFNGDESELSVDPIVQSEPRLGLSPQLVRVEADGALPAFMALLEYARDLPCADTDILYFLENDYLHVPGWLSKILALFQSGEASDIVSLYDHPDRYCEIAKSLSTVHTVGNHHWRTAPSTCASFLTTKAAFLRDFDLWYSGKPDHRIFRALVKLRRRTLLTPVPSLSTHCMSEYLAPVIPWSELAEG